MKKYSWKNSVYTFLSCILFVCILEAISIYINNEIYIPRVENVINSIISILQNEYFIKNVFYSFIRTSFSYSIALVLGLFLGVITIVCPFFEIILKPLNTVVKTIPTLVLVVLSLVWFDKDSTPFVVGFAVVFPILYEGIKNSIRNIDTKIIEMTQIYEVSLIDKIKKIYLPNIKFYLINIFVSTFSLTFKVVIAGEVHGQPKYGIGTSVQIEKMNFNTSGIFAWIIIIMVISLLFEFINSLINKRVYRWLNENRN